MAVIYVCSKCGYETENIYHSEICPKCGEVAEWTFYKVYEP